MGQSPEELRSIGFIPIADRLPRSNTTVLVLTPKFRSMAVLGRDGKWRRAGRSEEIEGVIAWSPLPGAG
jgi:hypothetical protein